MTPATAALIGACLFVAPGQTVILSIVALGFMLSGIATRAVFRLSDLRR